jgi:hypothetical protein
MLYVLIMRKFRHSLGIVGYNFQAVFYLSIHIVHHDPVYIHNCPKYLVYALVHTPPIP